MLMFEKGYRRLKEHWFVALIALLVLSSNHIEVLAQLGKNRLQCIVILYDTNVLINSKLFFNRALASSSFYYNKSALICYFYSFAQLRQLWVTVTVYLFISTIELIKCKRSFIWRQWKGGQCPCHGFVNRLNTLHRSIRGYNFYQLAAFIIR